MTSVSIPQEAATPPAAGAADETAGNDTLADMRLPGVTAHTDFAICLFPLLKALNWWGDRRHIAEAIPHFAEGFDLADLRNVMANLHFGSRELRGRLDRLDPRLMPCLFVPDTGMALVLLERNQDGIRVFDGALAEERVLDRFRLRGTAYLFTPIRAEDLAGASQKGGWFQMIGQRFIAFLYQSLGLTLVINLMALATPMFVMHVYDKVIPTKSMSTLAFLGAGVAIALACEVALRAIRAHILSFMGGRFDSLVGVEIFKRILYLQPSYTERATVGAQVTRIKDFENIREFFTGPMVGMFVELPFMPVFIAYIAFLGGMIAVLPVIMMALYAVLLLALMPFVRKAVTEAAQAGSRRQEFVVECLSKMQALKYTGAERTWQERYRKLSANAAMADFRTSQITALINTLSSVLMMTAGLTTMAVGVQQVLHGGMSVGTLVATMMLVWRALAPCQTAFITVSRLEQVRGSIRQINNLMTIKPERAPNGRFTPLRRVKGRITFSRVSLRYNPNADPALIGVSFDTVPGEVIGVVGHNGSGKSTIIKLIAGIYQPQAGSIRIDNTDVRQFDPIEIRHQIAYVPQACNLFYGTIAQNLRLANPMASDDDLRWATELAAVRAEIEALPEGFNTRLKTSRSGQLPSSFHQRLSLARAYAKRAPIMLMDEPGAVLDFESDQALMAAIRTLRGSTTTFIVTHRPSHLKIVDRVIWLDRGNIMLAGPTEQVMPKLPRNFV